MNKVVGIIFIWFMNYYQYENDHTVTANNEHIISSYLFAIVTQASIVFRTNVDYIKIADSIKWLHAMNSILNIFRYQYQNIYFYSEY